MFIEKRKGNYINIIMALLSDYQKIISLKNNAKEKGYSSCYIVAFKDGGKVKIIRCFKFCKQINLFHHFYL